MSEVLFESLISITIVVTSLSAAFAITRFTRSVVERYARRTGTTLHDTILPVLNRPLGASIVLVGLQASLLRLEFIHGISPLVRALEVVFPIIWSILAFMVAYRLVNMVLNHLAEVRRESHPRLTSVVRPLGTIIRLLIMVSLVFTVLNIVEVDIAPYILGWGLLGFAIVLALQPILQDLLTGFYVSIAQPYKIGDKIQLPSGETCDILDIKAQQAMLYNVVDRSYIRIPNTELVKTKVVSLGESGMSLTIPFKLTQDSNLELAKRLATQIVSSVPGISTEPEASVYLTQLDGPTMSFEIVCWMKDPSARRTILDSINTQMSVKFKENGLRFPT